MGIYIITWKNDRLTNWLKMIFSFSHLEEKSNEDSMFHSLIYYTERKNGYLSNSLFSDTKISEIQVEVTVMSMMRNEDLCASMSNTRETHFSHHCRKLQSSEWKQQPATEPESQPVEAFFN